MQAFNQTLQSKDAGEERTSGGRVGRAHWCKVVVAGPAVHAHAGARRATQSDDWGAAW